MVKLLAKTHIDHPFSTFLHFQDNSHLKKSVHVRPSDEQKKYVSLFWIFSLNDNDIVIVFPINYQCGGIRR